MQSPREFPSDRSFRYTQDYEPIITISHSSLRFRRTARAARRAARRAGRYGRDATPPATPTATQTPVPQTPAPTPDPTRLKRTENFLVLGADVRPGPWMIHTDSIMLLAIDHETQQVGVLSVPRDLWVDVPGWGADRINSAYFLGDYTKYKGGSPALAKAVAEKRSGCRSSTSC